MERGKGLSGSLSNGIRGRGTAVAPSVICRDDLRVGEQHSPDPSLLLPTPT